MTGEITVQPCASRAPFVPLRSIFRGELSFRGFLCWYLLPFQQSSQEMLHKMVDWALGMPRTLHSFLSPRMLLGWQPSLSLLYCTHTGLEHSPESRSIQSFLIIWNFAGHLLVGNKSPAWISFWGSSVKTSFPGDAFCSVSNQPESNEHNWLLPQDEMNKLIRFIIFYNKCVYLPGSFQHGTSLKWKKWRGERAVLRVENSGKRSRPPACLCCVTYSIARRPCCCSVKPQFAAILGLLK